MSDIGYGVDAYGEGVYGAAGVATGDRIVLDPVEIADGRVQLSLNSGEIRVGPEGPDWGEAAIEAFMAEQDIGQVPADFRIPNRQVRIPLLLGAQGPGFEAARRSLQAKVGLFQREGGWVKRNNLYADVVNASLVMPDRWGHQQLEPDVILSLEVLPDFYGDEIDLGLQVEVTNPTLIAVKTGILGDCPGRVRIVLTEFNAAIQRGVAWGWRSRHYSGADTAQLRYRAQDMQVADASTLSALTGSVSGTVIRHPGIGRVATPVMFTDTSDGPLTHTGSYRVWARAFTSSPLAVLPDNVRVRLAWDVGDYKNPSDNGWATIPTRNNFHVVDLGEVRLESAPVGEHRWVAQVQGQTSQGGKADISIDELWFQPLDESAGVLRASANDAGGAFTDYATAGLVDLSEATGVLNGKSMSVGGNWVTSGQGDFVVIQDTDLGGSYAYRNSTADTPDLGQLALAGTDTRAALTNQMFFSWSSVEGAVSPVSMLYQRYIDNGRNLHARVFHTSNGQALVYVYVANGGPFEEIGRALYGPVAADQTYALKMDTDADGVVLVWMGPAGSVSGDPLVVAAHPALKTVGSLASGRHGIRDCHTGPVVTRFYSWYLAWLGQPDAVMFPNRSLEIRTEGVFRESVEATRYGELADVEGDLPRIPVAGLEGRFSELFVKASRGDFGRLPDSGVDNLVESILYRPSYLFPRDP